MLITTNKRKRQTHIAWCRLRLFAKRYAQLYTTTQLKINDDVNTT